MQHHRILSFTAQTFTLSLFFVSVFNLALSGQAQEMRQLSELFALCGRGVSFTALGELLVLSFLISIARAIWFSQTLFKNMLMRNRITLMLISVFVMAGTCSALFGWFPLHLWQAWLGFMFSFATATAISFTAMLCRTQIERRKYQSKLHLFQKSSERRGDDIDGQQDN